MHIFRTLRCAALAAALIALMAGVGAAGEQDPRSAAISLERAGEIALDYVQGGTLAGAEYRANHGRGRYAVLVTDGDARVELSIDAATGQIMSMERKNAVPAAAPGGIDAARAREIALARTGGGTVVEMDRDHERGGRVVYEFAIAGPDRRYELEIDGHTGAIIEYQEKMPRNARWHD